MFAKIKKNAQIAYGLINTHQESADAPALRKLASSNHLARCVAYTLDKVMLTTDEFDFEELIDILDEDGQIREYYGRAIFIPVKGLVCYLLIGKDRIDNNRLHLAFRGTKDIPACLRDLERRGPGHESFFGNRDTILENICATIHQYYASDPVHLIVSGHSLGGADAENTVTSVLQVKAQLAYNNRLFAAFEELNNIDTITLNAVNSAGISAVKATEAKMDADFLANDRNLKIDATYILTDGDVVPQSGQAHVFANCDYSTAKINLIKLKTSWNDWLTGKKVGILAACALPFSIPCAIGLTAFSAYITYSAHKVQLSLEQQIREADYQIFSNNNPEGRAEIANKLCKHALDYTPYMTASISEFTSRMFGLNNRRTPSPTELNGFVWVNKEDGDLEAAPVRDEPEYTGIAPTKLKTL